MKNRKQAPPRQKESPDRYRHWAKPKKPEQPSGNYPAPHWLDKAASAGPPPKRIADPRMGGGGWGRPYGPTPSAEVVSPEAAYGAERLAGWIQQVGEAAPSGAPAPKQKPDEPQSAYRGKRAEGLSRAFNAGMEERSDEKLRRRDFRAAFEDGYQAKTVEMTAGDRELGRGAQRLLDRYLRKAADRQQG